MIKVVWIQKFLAMGTAELGQKNYGSNAEDWQIIYQIAEKYVYNWASATPDQGLGSGHVVPPAGWWCVDDMTGICFQE